MNQINVLWALRSPCDLNCQYCYFGTQEEALVRAKPGHVGTLSHAPSHDLPRETLFAFVEGLRAFPIMRFFIAGGEPLNSHLTVPIITELKAQGHEVVVCTNGIPLESKPLTQSLIQLGVDAVSVSLDSHIAEVNDSLRVDPRHRGWAGVIRGLKCLLDERSNGDTRPRVGVYTVVSRNNVASLSELAEFLHHLGVDYWVYQPISLEPSHPLFSKLSLSSHEMVGLRELSNNIALRGFDFITPQDEYLNLIKSAVDGGKQLVKRCFGGRDLFFIQPDGTVWDCPSYLKIRQAREAYIWSIAKDSPEAIFSLERRQRCTDCSLFSVDCVNMWPLMSFDRILNARYRTQN